MGVLTSRYLRTSRGLGENFRLPREQLAVERFESSTPTGHHLVYHSLFGSARKLSAAAVEVLRVCSEPCDLDQVRERFSSDLVDELMRLRYLVLEGVDDRAHIGELLHDRPERLRRGELFSALQLVLTNRCNFTCDYCFAYSFEENVTARLNSGEHIPVRSILQTMPKVVDARARSAADATHRPPTEMTFEVAEQAIENAIRTRLAAGGDGLSISLFGGEPTLNRSLILHLLRKYRRGEAHGIRLDWDITTNGSRCDTDLATALAEFSVDTAVSIDYLDRATGQYRGGSRQSAAWETIEGNIDALLARGIPVHLTSVLSAQTWDHWDHTLIDWAAARGIKEINVIVSFDNSFFDAHPPESVADRVFHAFLYGQECGVLLSGYWYQTYSLIVDEAKFARQADYKTCPAIGRMLSVEPGGAVFTCKATSTRVGNVATWDATFNSEGYREYGMRAYRNGPACEDCELEGTCSGGSTGSIETRYQNIETMDPGYCTFMRRLVNRLLVQHESSNAGSVAPDIAQSHDEYHRN
jgi:uncharacterized protein